MRRFVDHGATFVGRWRDSLLARPRKAGRAGVAAWAVVVIAGLAAIVAFSSAGSAGMAPTVITSNSGPNGSADATDPGNIDATGRGSSVASDPQLEGDDVPDAAGDNVLVHVAGAVTKPGLYAIPAGARVAAGIDMAGGAAPGADLDRVNLAAALTDGQQVFVPLSGEPAPAPAGGNPTAAGSPVSIVDINTADTQTLDELPGVGPATAGRIVAFRDEHGPFDSVEALLEVPGIGPAKLDAMRDMVTTG